MQNPDFSIDEFKEKYSVQNLCNSISKDNYKLQLSAPANSVAWLNELIKQSNLFDKVRSKKSNVKFSVDINRLVEETKTFRNQKFGNLVDGQREKIKILNRLLLQDVYPDKTPRYSQINLSDNKTLNTKEVNDKALLKAIDREHAEKFETLSSEEKKIVEELATPDKLGDLQKINDLSEAWKKLKELWSEAEKLKAHFAEEEKKTGAARKKFEELQKELKDEKDRYEIKLEEVGKKERDLDSKDNDIEKTLNELVEREKDIILRENEAKAGFVKMNEEAVRKLKDDLKQVYDELDKEKKEINDERDKLRKGKIEIDEEINQRLDEFVKELNLEKLQLRKDRASLQADREIFEEDKEYVEERVEKRNSATLERKDSFIADLNERLLEARRQRDELLEKLRIFDEATRSFGGRTPEEVLEKIRRLEKEKELLNNELSRRLDRESMQRLKELEAEEQKWLDEREERSRKVHKLEAELSKYRSEVIEINNLRDYHESLEKRNTLLAQMNEQLKNEIDEFTRRIEEKLPFPECSGMDKDRLLQSEYSGAKENVKNLKDFSLKLHSAIALSEPITLYYSINDVRFFLGGLAMSRLMLLQGISGTGKTSLPRAFAKAIGAGIKIVPVQAGWRDKQDLVGYYNTFEKKFYETAFTKALYEASTPYYKDLLYIVLLDEMNLSHPEHYFADVLSAMEQTNKEDQQIHLTDFEILNAARLLEKGQTLQIPENVWFVGTANHDETTVQFADKTYDRAHVMELPRQYEKFEPYEFSLNKVSLNSLLDAFEKAQRVHLREAQQCVEYLEENLAHDLRNTFGVGWGNRLEKQITVFVPVVVDAGGSPGEALDHVLATKILRKIKDRYDLNVEDLEEFLNNLNNSWARLDKSHLPEKSIKLINSELKRLGAEKVEPILK